MDVYFQKRKQRKRYISLCNVTEYCTRK